MNHIILIGFMGCGKTSVGIRLSYRLRQMMTDTDKWIEKKQGMSVSEIFARYGEEKFRHMETICLKKLMKERTPRIISVGGGLPMQEKNRKLLKKLGTVIYLSVTANTVWERLKNDTTRPLLQGENSGSRIEELLSKRIPIYEAAADLVIDANDKDFETILTEIETALAALAEYWAVNSNGTCTTRRKKE